MNNAWRTAWRTEYKRIFWLVVAMLVIGCLTGYWVLAVLLPCSIYIGWILFQIRIFEHWIRRGTKLKHAPNTNGIWQLIVQHINRSQKRDAQHKAKLKELVRRFDTTISALPYATITLNAQYEIEWANGAAATTLGIEINRDKGQRIDNLLRNPELQKLLHGADHSNSVQMASPVDNNMTLMVSCVSYGEQQNLLTAKDISQILAVEKLRKTFISNASHELRTPVTVISGYLEMIAADADLPLGLDSLVDNAYQQSVRMVTILDDLLSLSKLVEKEGIYSHDSGESIDLVVMVNKLVADLGSAEEVHNIEMRLSQPLVIRAIASEVYSLCENLLSNAIKYSAPGSQVIIDWQFNDRGWLGLQFIDEGEGIAEEDIPRLTERFYRVNAKRDHDVSGTGLGLSIVKHIIENHGGYLYIESRLGYGSTFTVYFPDYRVLS